MFPPALTVIDGNPDAAPLTDASHLQLVHEPAHRIVHTTIPRPLSLILIDVVIGVISNIRLRLEFTRERLEQECKAAHEYPERMIGGHQGW